MYILSGRERKKRKEKSWRCALIPKRICHVVLAKPLAAENKRKLITFSARIKESKQELKAGKNKAEANLYLPSWVSSLSLRRLSLSRRDYDQFHAWANTIQLNVQQAKEMDWLFYAVWSLLPYGNVWLCAERKKVGRWWVVSPQRIGSDSRVI